MAPEPKEGLGMRFKNRADAGKKLAAMLEEYRDRDDVVVIGLPRGGVVTAFEIAQALNLPLDVICPRKIGAPGNPEYAIGAITETGEGIFHEDAISALRIPQEYIQKTVEHEKQKAQERLLLYRKRKQPIDLEGKTVIIVDDGIATGATMKAAVRSIQSQGAEKIIVAAPVSAPESFEELANEADEVVCIDTPALFYAVGQFYESFLPTEDEEVISLLDKSKKYGTLE